MPPLCASYINIDENCLCFKGDYTPLQNSSSNYTIKNDSKNRPSIFIDLSDNDALVPLIKYLISMNVAFCCDYKVNSPYFLVKLLKENKLIDGEYLVASYQASHWSIQTDIEFEPN